MSEPRHPAEPRPLKEDPEGLVLRGRPRPAVRFRRGLIVGATGAVAAALVSLSWFALQPASLRKAATGLEADEPAHKDRPDALASVPSTYGDVPRLGPPLPGDLGRPILEQQRSAGEPPPAPVDPSLAADGARAADAERERLAAAELAARASPVIAQLAASAGAATPSAAQAQAEDPAPVPASTGAAVPAGQQRKLDFARAGSGGDVNPHGLGRAPSPWTLSAGTIIPASLVTGLDSDLPGTVLAQVTENVRDSATGRTVLIPQGARLIGSYDSVIAYGQKRALVVWKRIVFPDGSSIGLDNMPATDTSGYAGLVDKVDSHTWQLLKGIGLSTLLGVSSQLSLGGGGDLVRAIRESVQQNAAHAGDQITSRNLDVQPTLRIRPGWPLRVLVNKDLVLQPWRG